METISEKDKKRIIKLHYDGKCNEEIAKETGFSEYAVKGCILDFWRKQKER